MKKTGIAIVVTVVGLMAGCAGSREARNAHRDVIQEISRGVAPLAGFADLRVYTSLKTHSPGLYTAKDVHGTKDFKILLNIDGQEVELRGKMSEENSGSGARRDPEAGEGIRYIFSNNIRITAGTHRAVISVPSNGIRIERDITLPDGSSNSLTLEPVYGARTGKPRPGFYGVTSFSEGLDDFRIIMNGRPM